MDIKNLLGRTVSFTPVCMMSKQYQRSGFECYVRGRIVFISRHGWFRVRWYAGDTVQHECFKEADIGKDVTLVGKRC